MKSFLEGPPNTSSASLPSLRDQLLEAKESFLYASITEISSAGIPRCMLIMQIWNRARSLMEEVERRELDPELPWILCFETSLDLMIASWAAVLLERDAILWQIQVEDSPAKELEERVARLKSTLGSAVLITELSLMAQEVLQPLKEEVAPICLNHLPQASEEHEVVSRSRDARFYLQTSGTTGMPKLGVLTHHALAERYVHSPVPDPTCSRLSPLSFDSITGLGLLIPNRNRNVVVHPLRFTRDPWSFLQLAADYQVANIILSTTMARHLLQAKETRPLQGRLLALQHLSFGLEQIVSETVWRVMDLMESLSGHPVKLALGYGMTETGLLTATQLDQPERLLPPRGSIEPVSVGACMPGKRLRVVDEKGLLVDEDVQGQVEVSLDHGHLSGYLLEDGSFVPLEQKDGWIQTGDVGRIAHQQLTLLGRAKDVLVHGGRNIPLGSVDLALHDVEGLEQGKVAAVSLPDPETRMDQLFVAYAVEKGSEAELAALEIRLAETASAMVKVPVSGVVRLPLQEFPYTLSGKLKRRVLTETVQTYLTHTPSTSQPSGTPGQSQQGPMGAFESELIALWKEYLPEEVSVETHTHFFAAGGDSLRAAIMLEKTEALFQKRITLGAFYQTPTLSGLAKCLVGATVAKPDLGLKELTRLLRQQRDVIKTWPGEEPFPGSLIRVFHREGTQTPLVWVFQYGWEAEALAGALGPDVPLIAFHSWHNLVEIPDLETPLAEALTDRMLWEMLGVCSSGPLVLGGNCQGGVPALSMAHKLVQISRIPESLILSEWSFSGRSYAYPVHLIYGAHSPVAPAFKEEASTGAGWRELFPQVTVEDLPVDHGYYFQPGNVAQFAEKLRPFLARKPRKSMWSLRRT